MFTDTVQIDGSYGEGGGQILRTALSLSVITGRPVEFVNIRANRTPPGLKAQHLAAVNAAASLCDAEVDGGAVGSQRMTFSPRSAVKAGDYRFEIGTAGATTLVMQTVLLPLAIAADGASSVTVTGGTHVPHSPPAQYLEHVYSALLRRHGLSANVRSDRAGFFPQGGGEIAARIEPARMSPVDLSGGRGKLKRLTAHIVTSNLPEHVAERGAAAVQAALRERNFKSVQIETHDQPSISTGAAVVLVVEADNGALAGFTSIGERGKPMERVAAAACEEFWAWQKTNANCDEHLADQLVLPMALTPGESRWSAQRVTEHLRTVIWTVQQFLPVEARIDKQQDGTGLVSIHGIEHATVGIP